MQETQVQSLGGEDPQAEGMAIYFSILAWRIPWTSATVDWGEHYAGVVQGGQPLIFYFC